MHKTVNFSLDSRFANALDPKDPKETQKILTSIEIIRINFKSLHCSTAPQTETDQNKLQLISAPYSSLNAAQLFKASQLTNWVDNFDTESSVKTKPTKKLKKGWILKSWNCLNLWAVRHIDFLSLDITENKKEDVKLRTDISTNRWSVRSHVNGKNIFDFFLSHPSKKEYEIVNKLSWVCTVKSRALACLE